MVHVKQTVRVNNQGIGFLGLLTIAFIVLKLLGFIDWSWWYVTMPMWLVPAVFLGVAGILGLAVFVVTLYQKQSYKNRRKKHENKYH